MFLGKYRAIIPAVMCVSSPLIASSQVQALAQFETAHLGGTKKKAGRKKKGEDAGKVSLRLSAHEIAGGSDALSLVYLHTNAASLNFG